MTMAETAALAPAPFYPPVRIDAGDYRRHKDLPDRYRPVAPRPRTPAAVPPAADGVAYARNGRFLTDPQIGSRVNIYV